MENAMSTQIIDRVSDVQEQLIELLESIKEPLTEAVGNVASFVTERVELRAVPYAEEIPTPKEVIDNSSKFATKLVSTNKSVALSAARAASPLTDTLLDRKPAAKKAPAAKSSTSKPRTTKVAA
jgi:hypothetical protein